MLMLLPLLSDVVLLSRCPRYSLQITSEDTLVFSDQKTKAEMLEEWEVAADFTKLIWSLDNVDRLWIAQHSGGLALQVVGSGVAWLVDRQLRAARQLNRGEQPPALVAGRVGDGDAPGGQVRQRLLDVVTHQVELVLAWPVCGMHGDLGWRQLEDQPATAGVDPCKSEHVTDEDPISLRVGAVENDVCSVDHVSLWVELLRFLTRNVHEPRHAKFVSEHAKRIAPWGFLEWHCYVAAGRKLLEIAF